MRYTYQNIADTWLEASVIDPERKKEFQRQEGMRIMEKAILQHYPGEYVEQPNGQLLYQNRLMVTSVKQFDDAIESIRALLSHDGVLQRAILYKIAEMMGAENERQDDTPSL